MSPDELIHALRTRLPVEAQRARTERRIIRVNFAKDIFANITWEGTRYVGEVFVRGNRLNWYRDDDPGGLADQLLAAVLSVQT